ncbi:MAG: hypothetical protein Q9P01_04690 [Anaerolineae bacterium]|nr:hypothetical protein [Anaerolineae bacterium]
MCLLGYIRNGQFLGIANFSERTQAVSQTVLAAYSPIQAEALDLLTEKMILLQPHIILEPYQFRWLSLEP